MSGEKILPLAPIDRLIRKGGAERVSESAAEAMGKVLQEVGLEVSKLAKELANHAHRKTIIDEDVKLAFKQWIQVKDFWNVI